MNRRARAHKASQSGPSFVDQKSIASVALRDIPSYFKNLGTEFVTIQNPSYVHPPFDVCPLAPKILVLDSSPAGIVQDMDGTTTTTETLCLFSLEHMVREITARPKKSQWKGFDRKTDHPFIIGNSTTKHVEYLVNRYTSEIDKPAFRRSYVRSALQILKNGKDPGRRREVLETAKRLNWDSLVADPLVRKWLDHVPSGNGGHGLPSSMDSLIDAAADRIPLAQYADQVRAAIDIYYEKYHQILGDIGRGRKPSITDSDGKIPSTLIEPMPGVGVFLSAVKGWLGEDLGKFYEPLKVLCHDGNDRRRSSATSNEEANALSALGRLLEQHPVRVALVTSSIAYEARIVLDEVFRVIRLEIDKWTLNSKRKTNLLTRFQSPDHVFDVIITASDSTEIRLKPHRDLYTLALHRLGIDKADYPRVIGFEDSESGTVAIRAAGIGLCVAVPFSETRHHRLDFASYVLDKGLPEALLGEHLFVQKHLLESFY